MTFIEAAAEVLRQAGKPLHYKEIHRAGHREESLVPRRQDAGSDDESQADLRHQEGRQRNPHREGQAGRLRPARMGGAKEQARRGGRPDRWRRREDRVACDRRRRRARGQRVGNGGRASRIARRALPRNERLELPRRARRPGDCRVRRRSPSSRSRRSRRRAFRRRRQRRSTHLGPPLAVAARRRRGRRRRRASSPTPASPWSRRSPPGRAVAGGRQWHADARAALAAAGGRESPAATDVDGRGERNS